MRECVYEANGHTLIWPLDVLECIFLFKDILEDLVKKKASGKNSHAYQIYSCCGKFTAEVVPTKYFEPPQTLVLYVDPNLKSTPTKLQRCR